MGWENIDGHRTWVPSDAPGAADSDQQSLPVAKPHQTTELPPFSVTADYATCLVAVLFDPDDIPALADHPLFVHEADLLRAAAVDCEQEIEAQIGTARDRVLREVGR